MSDLGPAIVTGSVAIVVAVAGFTSTGLQARRTQRVQDKAAHREEKRCAYANCMAALYAFGDARRIHVRELERQRRDPRWLLKAHEESPIGPDARAATKAEADLTAAVAALELVAPDTVAKLAWKASWDLIGFTESDAERNNPYVAVDRLRQAMREDLGYAQD